jgi:hypothetical protein
MTFDDFLREYGALREFLEWKGDRDLKQTWNQCQRSDWMLDVLNRLPVHSSTMRLLACDFVRYTPIDESQTVWDLLTIEHARHAVEISERYANGEVTEKELIDTYDDDFIGYRPVALSAAMSAARGAACRAAVDAVIASVRYTENALAQLSFLQNTRAAALNAAMDTAQAAQCDLIRKRVSWMDVERMLEEIDRGHTT